MRSILIAQIIRKMELLHGILQVLNYVMAIYTQSWALLIFLLHLASSENAIDMAF